MLFKLLLQLLVVAGRLQYLFSHWYSKQPPAVLWGFMKQFLKSFLV